ncbi:flavoprotein [Kitasatospora sp. NPDC101801]|uniref:flavoprotein n=1 Tax=Kitasatospora sp. NPDC101801 TaxID=3364103 RepID=UPI0037F94FFA
MSRVLHLLGAAAPPVLHFPVVVASAQARGWTVCVGLTPTAADWLGDELEALAELTGHPVKSRCRRPGERDSWPPADVALLAPATLNSVNSVALGLTPSWPIGYAVEALGRRAPLAVMPCLKDTMAAHPQFDRSVRTLRDAGAHVLLGLGEFVPHASRQAPPYPWETALGALDTM